MHALRFVVAFFAIVTVLSSVSTADAQRRRRDREREPVEQPADPLQAAEQAYVEVDFEATLEHASAALQTGGRPPDRLARIYQLLGVSAAALGDPDGARDFFQRMLAVDPDATLDDTVPPRLRAPFLEARGVISARTDQLGVEVALDRARGALRVLLTDPFDMARMLRVHARLEGDTDFTTVEEEAEPQVIAPLTGANEADRIEYWVEILDPYGNQLAVEGSDFEPRTVGRVAVAGGPGPGPNESGGNIFEDPLFWVIGVGAVLVIGGVVTGILVDQASHVPVQTGVSFDLD